MSFFLPLGLALFLTLLSINSHANKPLPTSVSNELKRLNLSPNTLGLYAKEVGSKTSILDWNGNRLGNPASSIKVLTTFAGVDILGPNYRWPTEVYYTGQLTNQTLTGDIIIKGYGDPFFVNESMDELVAILRQKIKHISGRLIVDGTYFQLPNNYPTSLDGADKEPYNAIPDAMNMNFGTNKITITPNRKGNLAHLDIDPPIVTRKLVNQAVLTNNKCRWFGFQVDNQNPKELVIKSNPARSCKKAYSNYSVLLKPFEIVGGGFKKTWQAQGGSLSNNYQVLSGALPKNSTFLWRHFSKPLSEQIKDMNKKSNNVMTRSLFLTIAAKQKGAPGTLENGRDVFKAWLSLQGIGIGEKGIYIDNGAGLSRDTRITPKQMATIIEKASLHKNAQTFIDSLAIAGVDGTMRKRFVNHPAKGRIFVKTGTLNGVRTMAALVYAKSGKVYAVSSIHEARGIQNQSGTLVQNKVLDWLFNQ